VTPVLELQNIRKNYAGLRPLRLNDLRVAEGERVALSGLDAAAAELFVNLVTGAALPDEGTVRTFGRSTADITDGEAWLASLDQFGIVSPRAVLLEEATIAQNLAMPFTLQIDPIPPDVAERIRTLAADCGLDPAALDAPAGTLKGIARARVHLARAAALSPKLLVLEHPTADVSEAERRALGRDVKRVTEPRKLAAVALTMDLEFAEEFAHRPLLLEGATGALKPWQRKRGWFR
jgi:ABC-type sulfate/molybdate transport systems ATPase subunit